MNRPGLKSEVVSAELILAHTNRTTDKKAQFEAQAVRRQKVI
jgi:hypothetical protein